MCSVWRHLWASDMRSPCWLAWPGASCGECCIHGSAPTMALPLAYGTAQGCSCRSGEASASVRTRKSKNPITGCPGTYLTTSVSKAREVGGWDVFLVGVSPVTWCPQRCRCGTSAWPSAILRLVAPSSSLGRCVKSGHAQNTAVCGDARGSSASFGQLPTRRETSSASRETSLWPSRAVGGHAAATSTWPTSPVLFTAAWRSCTLLACSFCPQTCSRTEQCSSGLSCSKPSNMTCAWTSQRRSRAVRSHTSPCVS
mmetsp:Transcript_14946/g.34968  ORF Transcript_14946/g.34968 Transcript_14946/m.34968 type:complete len:255 (-) Transcript_14946:59-823(-)